MSMPPVGFEPTISAGEQPQIYALSRVATGTDDGNHYLHYYYYYYYYYYLITLAFTD